MTSLMPHTMCKCGHPWKDHRDTDPGWLEGPYTCSYCPSSQCPEFISQPAGSVLADLEAKFDRMQAEGVGERMKQAFDTLVVGRSCVGYKAELAPTVDITKPIVVLGINHNTKTVTLGTKP